MKREVQQQLALWAKVTDKEIYVGLHSIGNDKEPVVDGHNAKFFKKAWQGDPEWCEYSCERVFSLKKNTRQ